MKHTSVYVLFSILLMGIILGSAGCRRTQPEFTPSKYAPPSSGTPCPTVTPPTHKEKRPGRPAVREPASKTYTLAQLVDIALQNNPSTRTAWERARAAAARWAQARGAYYPSVSGNVGGTGGKMAQAGGSITPATGVMGQAGISLSYLLLDFGGREAGVVAAKEGLMAANWQHNQVLQDVLRDVPQAYYRYVGNKAQVRALETSLDEANISLESTEQRRRAGVSTIADVLQARSKVDQVRLDLAAGRGAVRITRGQLATAVGWPADAAFEVALAPEQIPLDRMTQGTKALIELAQQDRPDLAAARAKVRQQKAELRRAESALWPDLTATGDVGWIGLNAEMNNIDIDASEESYYGGLMLRFPLFEGFALRNKVREARYNLAAARSALREKQEAVIADVWSAYYNLHTASQQVETSETLFESAKQSYRVSLGRYRAGAADIVELLNAQSTLASARAQKVGARTDLLTSYAELIHAIGAELSTIGLGRDRAGPVPHTDKGGID